MTDPTVKTGLCLNWGIQRGQRGLLAGMNSPAPVVQIQYMTLYSCMSTHSQTYITDMYSRAGGIYRTGLASGQSCPRSSLMSANPEMTGGEEEEVSVFSRWF